MGTQRRDSLFRYEGRVKGMRRELDGGVSFWLGFFKKGMIWISGYTAKSRELSQVDRVCEG